MKADGKRCWVTDEQYQKYLDGLKDSPDYDNLPAHIQEDYLAYQEDKLLGGEVLSLQQAEHRNELALEFGPSYYLHV